MVPTSLEKLWEFSKEKKEPWDELERKKRT
jgi:hypothetical protein